MITLLDKGRIIGMKQAGKSNREISRETGHDRKIISRIWSEYCAQTAKLNESGADIKTIQAEMTAPPKYKGSGRHRTKYTDELDARLREIVEEECAKTRRLGRSHKQKLTNRQIFEKVCKCQLKNHPPNIIEIGHPIFKVRLNSRFVMGVADFSIILGGRFFA